MKRFHSVIIIALYSCKIFAQAGGLDHTFDVDGIVTTNLGSSYSWANAVTMQPDGKIVVAGYLNNGAKDLFLLTRYNTDGTLDDSFGVGGTATTDLYHWSIDHINALAIQPDGKIVVAGFSSKKFALARYNTNGILDSSFGVGGFTIHGFYGYGDYANAITLDPNGKIYVAGRSYNDTGNEDDFAIARYNANGTLDPIFGSNDGIVNTNVSDWNDDYANSVGIQPDGKIVVGGTSFNNNNFTLIRYDTDGSLDNDFGAEGIVITDFDSSSNNVITSVFIQPDSKILAAGYSCNDTDCDFALARYNSNGSLDSSFGTYGKLFTDFDSGNDYAKCMIVQPDDKIALAGYSWNGTDYDFALVRYNADGTIDSSFSTDGKLTTAFYSGNDWGNSMCLQPDGKIVAAGVSNNGANAEFALVRYNTDGSADISFNGTGKLTTAFNFSGNIATSVAVQTDGRMVILGYLLIDQAFSLTRYNTDGSLDNSFSDDGIAIISVDLSDFDAIGVAIQSDDKIVVVGNSNATDFALARYNANGTLDNSFGINGKVTTDITGLADHACALAIQPDGKILVAGSVLSPNDYSGHNAFALVRYNTDGTLDGSFSADGKVIIDLDTTNVTNAATSLAIQPDGKIVIAGYSIWVWSHSHFSLVRCNADGTLDSSFGDDGIVINGFDFGDNYRNIVAIKPDGNIVEAGSSGYDFTRVFVLVQHNTFGILDSTFGIDGKALTDFETGDDYAKSMVVQPDGKIVTAGYTGNYMGYAFALSRHNPNGILDSSFGIGGKVITSPGAGYDEAYSLALQPDGKILLAGSSFNGADDDLAITRYLSGLNVGVINFTSEIALFIYPNPIQQTEQLEFTLTKNELLTLNLYDLNGRLIKNFYTNEERKAGAHKEKLIIGQIIPGSYLLTLSNGIQNLSVKLVKL